MKTDTSLLKNKNEMLYFTYLNTFYMSHNNARWTLVKFYKDKQTQLLFLQNCNIIGSTSFDICL